MRVQTNVYPHNDLLNLAYHHLETVKQKGEDGSGKGLDCLACIIALAFATEAIINFVGYKRVNGWNERANSETKINIIFECFLPEDEHSDLKEHLHNLRSKRNTIAHGKPVEIDEEIPGEDITALDLSTLWEVDLNLTYCEEIFNLVRTFKRLLFERAGIGWAESLTNGLAVSTIDRVTE